MEDQQELVPEGWQAHDLRSGVAKVFAEAKARSTLGIRVAGAWAIVLVIYGAMDFTGVSRVAHPLWDVGVGFSAFMLAALSMSRAPGPLLGAAGAVLADLAVIAYQFPDLAEHGTVTDYVATGVRIAVAPVSLFFVINGYFGSLSIQAFKKGFSPGADWRTRISPRMLQLVVIGSCVLALSLGLGSWIGAIMTGFAQTDVVWVTRSMLTDPIEMKVARTVDVEDAETDGKKQGVFTEITVLNRKDVKKPESTFPESAMPITSTDGFDKFAAHNVEEAFKFAARTDETGCMAEAQGRQDRCRDDRCRYWARVFARACLAKSGKTRNFCNDVPAVGEETLGAAWAQRMCAGRAFETCREILLATQGHCHPPKAGEIVKAQGGAASK